MAQHNDTEAQPPALPGIVEKFSKSTTLTEDEWAAHDLHPRNWPNSKRWKNALIIAVTGFLSTTGSSIFVSATGIIQEEFNAPSHEVAVLTTALYVMGLGAGPFLFAPISELNGRQVSYVVSMTGFTFMNLGCAFVKDLKSLIILRFLAGTFGSSGPGLGVATISDLFAPKERGLPISIYAIGPMMGPTLGSILGNYVVLLGWRWCFRIMTILVGLNTLSILFFMNETYSPVVKAQVERRLFPPPKNPSRTFKDRFKFSDKAKFVIIKTFTRPPRMLVNPLCALFVTYYAYVYSIIYVFLVSLPLLFAKHNPPIPLFSYNWPSGTTGLCYIGMGVGFLSAAATAATMQDRIYKYLCQRYQDDGRPEYRLVITQLGMIVFPLGLLIWAWTAEAQTQWMGPMVGSAVFAWGLMMAFNSIQNWIVDEFYPYSAAAMAAASLLRSTTGCVLPIFADNLFLKLGYGWGGTLLALVSLPALPAPVVLFYWGPILRKRFKFVE
ncbi:MFS general substrate transporter [Meredithblackwellia eburnea MCA 4105]